MQITRSSIDTQKGPAEWFTGDVYIDAVAAVHVTPGARAAWHTRVVFEPGGNHWHGAAPDRFMLHIAMQHNDDSGSGGRAVVWGEHVTDEQYEKEPAR